MINLRCTSKIFSETLIKFRELSDVKLGIEEENSELLILSTISQLMLINPVLRNSNCILRYN